ncbi:MAG: 3-hydroxyisobutyrate dehydrogenase [Actinomycetota bacterium]|nr:3-hydroxyisobutyrate dehydrogenase [Actinomycetota bacterium]
MRVGVIGLGNIGGHVAANLVTVGHEVVVFDVDSARAGSIKGASAAATVADVGAASEVTVLSLPTPTVVRQVADEWVTTAAPGSVLVDLSTNSPEVVRELGTRLLDSGHHLVEAPLTGGAPGAENRMLSFMVGGDDDAVARVQPVLEPLGRAFVHLGPLGLGNTMKLVNSLIAFTTTWVSLEGLSLAAKSGIPVQQAVEVLRTNGVANFYLDRMVESIDARDRPTQFALGLAAKDAGLIVETGRALGVPTPAGGAVLQVLVGAIAAGLGDRDWSDLVTAAERQGDVELHWATD